MTETPRSLIVQPEEGSGDDLLRVALQGLRIQGSIFLRGEFTEDWAYASPPSADMAAMLKAEWKQLILFHIVAAGTCWVAVCDGERHWAQRGDVIVLPYGDAHQVGGTTDAEVVPIADLLAPPPWEAFPHIRYGGGGGGTDIVCGYLEADDPLFDPSMRALPPLFVVRPTGAAASWVEASIAYALEQTQAAGGSDSIARLRLPELLLLEVLKIHLATAPASQDGWLAALRDPVLAPALALLHRQPARKWTVADLAAGASVSRSLLTERFGKVLGRPPMRYLTEWRMHEARELLATTNLGVAAIARRVGYDSEEAFSRGFKRAVGRSPSHWRAERMPRVP